MKKPRKTPVRFAVCIKNKGYKASLEVGKLYRVIPDREAASHGYLRIVDESEEDYGYAASRFFSIDVPKPLERPSSGQCPDNASPNSRLERPGSTPGAQPERRALRYTAPPSL